ncbi:Organic hydroperoxide resistance transcriptional regulator [Minicystis rosea]|nr:Organic hydroperoxide resistance transcriptional regulator [Minicystis rosea]
MQAPEDLDATDDVGLGEVIEFMRLLWAVDHGLEASSKQMDSQLGVTGPQRLVIRIVGKHPGIAAGQLADILHVHPSTLTGVLSRLVDRGLLTRKVDPTDARRALFGLTAQGRKLDEVKSGTIESKVRRALTRVSPREVTAARKVLGALAEALEPPQKPAPAGKAKNGARAKSE